MSTESSPKLEDFQEGLPEDLPPEGRGGSRRLHISIAVAALLVLALGFATLMQQRGVSLRQLQVQGTTGGIAGQVVLEDGRPLQAEVIVVKAGISATADAEGRFQLNRVPAGEQELVVGYRGAGRAYPITVPRGEVVDIGQIRFISTLEPDS